MSCLLKKIHVKTGDLVYVLSGKDRGSRGKILAVSYKESKVMVQGINIVSKHVKPKKAGEEGGVVKTEGAMHVCKVQLICSHCDKPTRIAHKSVDGKKSRTCKHCGEII